MFGAHFSQSPAGGVLADAAMSSPGSWPLPLGMAFTSAGEVSTVAAGLSSLISAQVSESLSAEMCRSSSLWKCVVKCSVTEVLIFFLGSVGEKKYIKLSLKGDMGVTETVG